MGKFLAPLVKWKEMHTTTYKEAPTVSDGHVNYRWRDGIWYSVLNVSYMDELIEAAEQEKTARTQDPIVNSVIDSFIARSNAGMIKYGMTMKDNPLDVIAWARHAQQEAMDFICYLERLIEGVQNND